MTVKEFCDHLLSVFAPDEKLYLMNGVSAVVEVEADHVDYAEPRNPELEGVLVAAIFTE